MVNYFLQKLKRALKGAKIQEQIVEIHPKIAQPQAVIPQQAAQKQT